MHNRRDHQLAIVEVVDRRREQQAIPDWRTVCKRAADPGRPAKKLT
jgi:hypothetical protein